MFLSPLHDVKFQKDFFEELKRQSMLAYARKCFINIILAMLFFITGCIPMFYMLCNSTDGFISTMLLTIGIFLYFDGNGFAALRDFFSLKEWPSEENFKKDAKKIKQSARRLNVDVYTFMVCFLGIQGFISYSADKSIFWTFFPMIFIISFGLAFKFKENANECSRLITEIKNAVFSEEFVNITRTRDGSYLINVKDPDPKHQDNSK